MVTNFPVVAENVEGEDSVPPALVVVQNWFAEFAGD